MKIFGKSTKVAYGEMVSVENIVVHPQSTNRDPVVMEKLKKVTPFLTILREKGMTYKEIAGILEVLTGMDIPDHRVRNYIVKANPQVVRVTITDREDDGA
jgi:hypothetical protein